AKEKQSTGFVGCLARLGEQRSGEGVGEPGFGCVPSEVMSLGQLAPGFVVGAEREECLGVLRRHASSEPAELLDSADGEARSFSVATLAFGDDGVEFRLGAGGGDQRVDEVLASVWG